MMISPSSSILKGLSYKDLVEYLRHVGWQPTVTPNNRWVIFRGAEDVAGEVLEIILPSDPQARDIYAHFANAINTLCAVTDTPPENLLAEIKYFDRDILRVKNPEMDHSDALSLKVAAQQVFELKQLVAYAACSEDDPKPYFVNAQLPFARRMVEQYRFGHTFRGSFGFTIETPPVSSQAFSAQLSLIPEKVAGQKFIPPARRVMERIARGLLITQEATKQGDVRKIVQEYRRAFNSNMCQAIVNMSVGKKYPLEFAVTWSKIEPPSDDKLRNMEMIRFDHESYTHLAYAAELLSKIEPEDVTITGLVTDLSAKDNPLGLDTSRSIIIRWYDKTDGKTHKVYVVLSREDYLRAIKAHQEWRPVTITGTLQKVKRNWRIIDYRDFRVD